MAMSRAKRVFAGAGANVINLLYVTLVTGLSVPVLTHAWGVRDYGLWVMLSALPTYLALSDFGFSTAATNDIAMNVARDELDTAVQTFQSVWALNLLIGGGVVAAAVLACLGTAMFVGNATITLYASTALILTIYAVACLLSRSFLGALRATGNYAQGSFLNDTFQFVEGCASLAAAYLGGGFLGAATALLAIRLLDILALYGLLRSKVSWLPIGFRHASQRTLKRLIGPAFGSMSIPISLALNMQGVALVVGLAISPTATAVITTSRTVSRIAVQVISAVNRALVPELSAASAQGDHAAIQKIEKLNTVMLVGVAVPAAVFFGVFGSDLIGIWTGGQVAPPQIVVALLGLAMGIHSIWFFGTNLLSATNAHGRMATGLLPSAIVTVVLAKLGSDHWGLEGAAAAVAAGETLCLCWFFWVSRAQKINSTYKLHLQTDRHKITLK
ncbi:lipopolysaccharide biosynthesis protein [Brevundimonas nasdae]|uniref:Lipopolysaccharide biosynthesis protein n=1 Tax=Brevundimonas nasdae TaxID=172043 RepID=A0ABX8TIG3_9CAUL|nr:lipopolysaccharide biosynthesis protein [Brevundimonas nasdae]QYC09812.1 lipopolysaccharide biosynthesis protein [Brevundimonas nasdae]QYC12601.1 lipopolysaccharide biosynthesis protein [Brevundimonas nasdae]